MNPCRSTARILVQDNHWSFKTTLCFLLLRKSKKIQMKGTHNNLSGHETDRNISERFKVVPEEEECRWSLLADMGEYANENLKEFIPEWRYERGKPFEVARPENINSAISLVNLILWLLKQKKTGYQLNSTFEKNISLRWLISWAHCVEYCGIWSKIATQQKILKHQLYIWKQCWGY